MAMIAPGEGTKERNPVEYQFPTGVYVMALDSVTEIGPSAKFPNGNNRLVFEFRVVEGPYAGKKACAFIGKSLHKNQVKESKLIGFVRDMGVQNPEHGFDPDSLVGKIYTCKCESQPGPNNDPAQARTWLRTVIQPGAMLLQQQMGVPGVSQPPPANGVSNSPPPAAPPPAVAPVRRYWIDFGVGPEGKMVTDSELRTRFANEVMDWDNVRVYPEGGSAWQKILEAIPAAKEWAQKTPF